LIVLGLGSPAVTVPSQTVRDESSNQLPGGLPGLLREILVEVTSADQGDCWAEPEQRPKPKASRAKPGLHRV